MVLDRIRSCFFPQNRGGPENRLAGSAEFQKPGFKPHIVVMVPPSTYAAQTPPRGRGCITTWSLGGQGFWESSGSKVREQIPVWHNYLELSGPGFHNYLGAYLVGGTITPIIPIPISRRKVLAVLRILRILRAVRLLRMLKSLRELALIVPPP